MQSSNLAARMEFAAPDLLVDAPRPKLRVVTNSEPQEALSVRPRTSLEFRSIVIRDHGFRHFRIF